MPTSDGPSRFPVFVAPSHSNHQRSPGYVAGRVAPVSSPPPAKAPPPLPLKPRPPQRPQQVAFNLQEQRQQRENRQILQRRKNALILCGFSLAGFLLTLIIVLSLSSGNVSKEECPHHNIFLKSWNPGHRPDEDVFIKNGELVKLESSATFNSLTIQSGGQVVFDDDPDGSKNITLRTHHILIEDGGALHIGGVKCRYQSSATIALIGRSDDDAIPNVPGLGSKFIGVSSGATLELHGTDRVSWSLLTQTISANGLATGAYIFQKVYSRGIHLRVVDQDTANVLFAERYDTHDSEDDSHKLTQLLRSLPAGRIVAIAVGDSAAKNFLQETKKAFEDVLGSRLAYDLQYREAWALVSVVGGGNESCSEDVREHENLNTKGRATASRNFTTIHGENFAVDAYSEWTEGHPIVGFHVVGMQVTLNLQDEVSQSWKPGDKIVVASTDYSMRQAEEFTLVPCPHCTSRQVKIKEKPLYTHIGEVLDGVDMRAEVALLSRNILIYGEMENSCNGKMCQFFGHDTFGGHVKIFGNFSSVHLSHVEFKNMGQQQEKGRYPLHFHVCGDVDQKGGYKTPTFVDGLSIHHSFSRCLVIQATNGLLVKNTVGYDTLGHCFFLEDGIEQRNTFYHNLGLVTRSGTLLPTDRNDTTCTSIKHNVGPGYTPSPSTDCKAVSTFWIANPNNNLISNAAAGSQDAGVWFVFPSSSTGDSHGLVADTKAELTPLGIFYNNRVHSNFKAGLFIDKGVKTTNASDADPREYLCLDNSARFRPHKNADSRLPRVAAVIDNLISFKNNDLGAWIRGGDIVIKNSGFADNGVGLSFTSDGSYPKDDGSSQEVTHSLFVGESQNRGTNSGGNKYSGVGGIDRKNRTLPRNRTYPIRGFQIYDGPVRVKQSTFRGFSPTSERFTSAIGFNLKNMWQLTPQNSLSKLSFHPTVGLKAYFGSPGEWYEENNLDGDKNSIFHDLDGSVTGYRDTYAGRLDNSLIQHPDCVKLPKWNAVICSGRYAQLYIRTQGASNLSLTITRDEYSLYPIVLRGINSQRASYQQYQPVLMMSKSYTMHWNGPAPKEILLSLINFDNDDWVLMGLCYSPNTMFQIIGDVNDRQKNTFSDIKEYSPVASFEQLRNQSSDRKYYFDSKAGILWFYLRAQYDRHGHSYCSVKGCERVKIIATSPTSIKMCDCMKEAYPKYAQTPAAVVPMPAPNKKPCDDCGTQQLVFSSEPWNSYLKIQIKSLSTKEQKEGDGVSFISVNDVTMRFSQPGFFLVLVDACFGNVTKMNSFAKMDNVMSHFLKFGIPKRSIVLIASRGELPGLVDLSPHLVSLGLAKSPDLDGNETLYLWGFSGDSAPPPWILLQTGRNNADLGLQERYLPLGLTSYGCSPTAASLHKDLELLKKATGQQ